MGKFNKGINRDTDPIDQPDGSWRYAKNIIIEPNSGAIQFERGTEWIINIAGAYNPITSTVAPTPGYQAIGNIVLQDDRVVIFSVFPDTTNPWTTPGTSEVGIFDPTTSVYTTVYNDYAQIPANQKPLNFRKEYPIQGEYKIDGTGQTSVYWTDDNEVMRFMRLYAPPVTGTAFDMETINVFPLLSSAPNPRLKEIIGGVLGSGVYALAVALVNDEGTPTNYVNMSAWVKITDDTESSAQVSVDQTSISSHGHTTSNLATLNVSGYTGCPPDFATGKGITWVVDNLDSRYSFIRPIIIYKIGGVTECIKLQDIDYDVLINTSADISYTGNETAEAEILSNILIARESYVQAKTVAQVDDVLYWGNLVKSKIDLDYQPYANNIEIEAYFANPEFKATENVNGDPVDFRPRDSGEQRTAVSQYYRRGFQRDETYAFYISWIMADGNETVSYHIPGREPISISGYAGAGRTETSLASTSLNAIPAKDIGTGAADQISHMQGGDIKIYKASTYGASIHPDGMGYWENDSEMYPNDPVNYGVPLNADGTPSGKASLAGTPVRHHHFPAASNGENGAVTGGGHIWAKQNSGGKYQTVVFNPLGFRAKNIPIPKAMEGKVVGYKLYYAYRDEANSTVIDCGIFNATPSYHGAPKCGKWGAGYSNGWGDSGSCWSATLSHPKNGYMVAGFSSNCWSNWVTYAVQNPPGGDDYTGTGMLDPNTAVGFMTNDTNTGGDVVCTPFSAVHAPYSNVGYDGWGTHGYSQATADGGNGAANGNISPLTPGCCDNPDIGNGYDQCYHTWRRLTDLPLSNHFTFNGLHSHINKPDLSTSAFVKLQRHMRIGEGDGSGGHMMAGSAFIRLDQGGNAIRAKTKHCVFFNWTLMAPIDYADPHTEGVLYDVPLVQSGLPNPNAYRQSFRAITSNTTRYIEAGQNINVSGSSAGRIINDGGCQTVYLQTYNNIYTHNYIMWMNFYMMYAHIRYADTDGAGTGHPLAHMLTTWYVNYPHTQRSAHHWMHNKFDSAGWSSTGNWAFKTLAVGHTTYNGKQTLPEGNWQDGWTSAFDYSVYWCHTYTPSWGAGIVTAYTASDDDDDVNQYMAYGAIHRQLNNLYNTFDTQTNLVYTGHTQDITGLVIPATGLMYNPSDKIFGGDTYIDFYCETRHMKGKGQSMHTGGGPNYCASGNATDGPSGCCGNGLCWTAGSGWCENIDFSDEAGESQGYFYQSDRWSHYAYGVMGDMPSEYSTDITQQLYVTESKVNITERFTGNDVNEDFFPAVHRQNEGIVNWNSGPRLFSYDQTMSSLMNLYPTVVFNHLNKTSNRTDYPTRIIRSVQYNKSGLVDNFRTYKPGQYRDLPRNRGELWNLAVYDNVLVPQLERALMKTKGKESLQTGGGLGDVSEIALGDGDLFAQDPNEILYTNRGYAGTLSQWSVVTSRFGHLSVDKKTGKIFLMSDKLEEISSYGMRGFFSRRLTTWALEQYGLPYNIDLPTLNIGVISSFDPKYARFIITKLDKKPTNVFITGWNVSSGSGKITWNDEHRAYQKEGSGGSQTLINFEDGMYFSDLSWTVSYYPSLKVWGSIHDFTPRMYFYTTNNLYSIPSGLQNIWEHNYATGTTEATASFNIATYYSHTYDVMFEYIDNMSPLDNKLFYNVNYTVDVEVPAHQDSGARHNYQDSGFTHMTVYNSRQVSSELQLVEPEGQNNNLWTTATVRRKERTWYVKGFRDDRAQAAVAPGQVLDAPVDTNILVSDYLNANIPINVGAYSFVPKSWDQRRKMVDKWMAVRLIAKNYSGTALQIPIKLVTLHESSTTKRKTYR
tara:strand:- start:27937 stop:33345 length:5409 start_codon:yes stop_codon:yes gene_type:complete